MCLFDKIHAIYSSRVLRKKKPHSKEEKKDPNSMLDVPFFFNFLLISVQRVFKTPQYQ